MDPGNRPIIAPITMTNLTIALPDRAQAYITAQIASGRYSTADEVLNDLIEQAQEQEDNAAFDGPAHLQIQSRAHLDQLLIEGHESGEAVELTDELWEAKRQRLLERIRHRS
jgi:antitoxin ParD1/3/4